MKYRLEQICVLGLALVAVACESGPDTSPQAPSAGILPPSDNGALVPGVPVFACDAPVGDLTVELPCQVGYALAGSGRSTLNVVECGVRSSSGGGKMSIIVPLGEMSQSVGAPMDLSTFPPAPLFALGDRMLSRLEGKAIFSTVDLSARAFLGRFVDATLVFTPDVACHLEDGLFWAVPGAFL